jgi:anti-sigma factor RsiW
MDIAFAVLVANVAITRYFDGELSPANRQRVEERLHTDPALRACLELRTKKRNSTAPDGDGDIFSDAAFDTEKLLVHLALKREGIRVPAIATHPRLCASLIVESERR